MAKRSMANGWLCEEDGTWAYYKNWKVVEPETPAPTPLQLYTEGPCKEINTFLRTGVDTFDPAKCFGMKLVDIIAGIDNKLEELQGSVPTMDLWRFDQGYLYNAVVNGIAVDKGFLSTSMAAQEDLEPPECTHFYHIVGATGDSGAYVAEFSKYSEEEFLFHRNSIFKVLKTESKTLLRKTGFDYYWDDYIREEMEVTYVELEYIGRA